MVHHQNNYIVFPYPRNPPRYMCVNTNALGQFVLFINLFLCALRAWWVRRRARIEVSSSAIKSSTASMVVPPKKRWLWSPVRESNSQKVDYKSTALPLSEQGQPIKSTYKLKKIQQHTQAPADKISHIPITPIN